MRRNRPQLLSTLICLLLLAGVPAQSQYNPYEQRFGEVVEVSVDDLTQMPESYIGKAVRTRGRLEMLPAVRESYGLRGIFGGWIRVYPVSEVQFEFDTNARRWMGGDVEVTGVFTRNSSDGEQSAAAYAIMAWGMVGPPDEKETRGPVTETTLEELLTKPGRLDGKVVRVRGQFRGQNLFGDLPAASRKKGADWVLKEDLFAVWVTGRKPKGSGWSFDAGMKRDTGKWLEVTGRVSTSRGVVTIDARELTLVSEPKAAKAEPLQPAQAPPPPPPRPKKPPVVVFSLPLDGEREVPPDTVFRVQFSKDMEEPSFKDRVVLRYAGRLQPGDRELDAVKVTYDGGLRTLNVDPGDLLRPGRIVEILLLPGIVDLDGLPLETRPGRTAGAASDVLRFQIGAPGLLGGIPR